MPKCVDARIKSGHDAAFAARPFGFHGRWRDPFPTVTFAFVARPHRRRILILNKPTTKTSSLPSKADLIAFIGRQPGKVGTREIARAFGLKNAMRVELKRMLRELADDGSVEKRRKR